MLSTAHALAVAIFATLFMLTTASLAQKLVDPDKVAPEFHDAAVKRRAEQIKIQECNHNAEQAKVLHRDRAAFIQHCLDEH
jgi:hypothetical protein